ncbi:MBL fold metallo-hydrolase [Phenylobacterium sp. LjRoot225]|uniref:MBL fold metallo-hydrolase n=1 Tax=Phenylobacterium sp. LjRoot225 TaxID=3342285 RepID=UPI003ECD04D0
MSHAHPADDAPSLPIAERWFEHRQIDADLTLLWEPHVHPLLRCNIWRLRGRDADLLVDSGLGLASLRQAARELLSADVLAVATHVHSDHAGGLHEFDHRLVHAAEAEALARGEDSFPLDAAAYPPGVRAAFRAIGYDIEGGLLTAAPHRGFDARRHVLKGCEPTRRLAAGDVVDLGDRAFEVLHLPGHSPGSIGLWEAKTGILFSGDAVYDGPLLDQLPGSDMDAYAQTMRRLLELPVTVVHAGHDPSFGRERLHDLARGYLAQRDQAGAR